MVSFEPSYFSTTFGSNFLEFARVIISSLNRLDSMISFHRKYNCNIIITYI